MEMEATLAAADAFRIDDASCAVTQFWANIHDRNRFFAWTHTYYNYYITISYNMA